MQHPSRIVKYLRPLLKKCDLYAISYAACVPYPWLRSVLEGRVKSPKVDRCERLFKALTGREIL
jgi:hypothetical protein